MSETTETDMGMYDNLDLDSINMNDVPKNIFFPEEMNLYLRGQIQFLAHSNGMLQKTLSERDQQLKTTQEKITDLNNRLASYDNLKNNLHVDSAHVMSTKIVEMSKQLRDRHSELESLRTKYSKAQQKIATLTNENNENKVSEIIDEKKPTDELKELQDKISGLNNKLFDVKNTNLQLKTDLKLANKVLQQEIGDSFTSIQNLGKFSNWRGRAQQILTLQQKNSELLEQISVISNKGSCDVPTAQTNRKSMVEQLMKELDASKHELDDIKKKLNGSRARIKVMENDNFDLRVKYNSAVEKNNHDMNLLMLLKDQIANLEENNAEMMKSNQQMWKKLERENKDLKCEISKEKCVQENYQVTIRQKDDQIAKLKNQKKNNNNQSEVEIDTDRVQMLETEIKRLLEIIYTQNKRLNLERDMHSETQANFRKERQKSTRLENKISVLEIESNLQKSHSYKSITKSAGSLENVNVLMVENLKNNLELAEENILCLRTKLDILQREKELDLQHFAATINEKAKIKHECAKSE